MLACLLTAYRRGVFSGMLNLFSRSVVQSWVHFSTDHFKLKFVPRFHCQLYSFLWTHVFLAEQFGILFNTLIEFSSVCHFWMWYAGIWGIQLSPSHSPVHPVWILLTSIDVYVCSINKHVGIQSYLQSWGLFLLCFCKELENNVKFKFQIFKCMFSNE